MPSERILFVPGGGVRRGPLDCDELRGTDSLARCDRAYRAWLEDEYWTRWHFTGGMPAPERYQTIPEAALMATNIQQRSYPLSRQVTDEIITTELRANQTFENVEFSLPILERSAHDLGNVERIGVVTDLLHYRRFFLTFTAWGFDRLEIVQVDREYTSAERAREELYYRLSKLDPKGQYVGRAFSQYTELRKRFGGGR